MRSAHVSDIGPLRLRPFHFLWRPVRHTLGVEAFGVNAYTQPEAGGELIEEHDETGGGAGKHQELYVVLSGRATFRAGDRELDAPAGTLVFFDDPAERRSAVAAEENTTVLAVGAPLGGVLRGLALGVVLPRGRPAARRRRGRRARHDGRRESSSGRTTPACTSTPPATRRSRASGSWRSATSSGRSSSSRAWPRASAPTPDLDALRGDNRFAEILARSAGA